ncbi:hypothetical protein D5F01_LYC11917 [Larimichthys crocea]|uniref:Uncharacterized protein n=1 Tax=Larimichthys crocea TaxID=215358 RepID=A0A6G0IF78_LARCR|nr:hypothetical protein D5F01_LYC11917 [Larimichthys crocea]
MNSRKTSLIRWLNQFHLCDSLQMESEEVQDNDALEEQASAAPATDEEPDDLTESISKHQQLSDIPEEGIISDTMVTPASFNEEAARDDTIAEDLIEITSEAITAPEPASDITLPDETEMISAVSQLSSESSKTSGNTTPVPAEYDVMETDTLLNQVVETISITPESVPVFSDELINERIAGSLVEAHHAETEPPKTDSQEADTAATLTIEDMSAAETVTSELKEEMVPLTEVNVEPEKEDELETEAAKTEDDQVPEESEAVEASTLDSEESSGQSPKEEVISEDTAPAETVTDEPKQTAEHVQEPEVLEAVEAPTLDTEVDSVQSVEKEVMSEDVPEEEQLQMNPKKKQYLSMKSVLSQWMLPKLKMFKYQKNQKLWKPLH